MADLDGARAALRRAVERLEGGGARDDGGADDDGGARRRRAASRRARADVDLHHALGARAERAIERETGAYASAASAASAAKDASEDAYESLAHVARGCSARAFVRGLGTWTTTLSERVRASERGGASGATRAASEALRETLTRAGGLADVPGVRKECSNAIATASSGDGADDDAGNARGVRVGDDVREVASGGAAAARGGAGEGVRGDREFERG